MQFPTSLQPEEIAAILLLALYHVTLYSLVKLQPNRTVIGITRQARCLWIKYLIQQKQSILAIQTLRNWIMQSTMLGATSSSLSIGLIAFLATTSAVDQESSAATPASTSITRGLLKMDVSFPVKIVAILFFFLTSFFWFSQAMRLFNHVSVLVATASYHVPPPRISQQSDCETATSTAEKTTNPPVQLNLSHEFISSLMNRGALYQTIGMRCFYLTLPLMFWLFGPVFFLVASLFMVSLLISLDIAIA